MKLRIGKEVNRELFEILDENNNIFAFAGHYDACRIVEMAKHHGLLKKVFIVTHSVGYEEQSTIVGIFSTKRRAKTFQRRCENDLNNMTDDDWEIRESWDVGEWVIDDNWKVKK